MIIPEKCKKCLEGINKKHQEDLDFQLERIKEKIKKMKGKVIQVDIGEFDKFISTHDLLATLEERK